MATIRFDTRFPGYEVLSELGRSNARILKARHLATGDLVAIKHFALNTDDETLRRFQRESAIMTSIAHPNIVKVREVQLEAELPYIVMELIEGGNLHQLIRQQERLDIPTTIRLGLQMASALKAIHPQGIIHRDIKPENILYRPLPSGELHFLLTDFGVARLHEQSNTLTGQSLMTYEYASPEQFNDPKAISVATDYYSLGVVLYECLHGSVPFALDDHSGIVTFMNKVLNETPPALTVTSSDQTLGPFVELLQGLLKKKASERVDDPDELTWLLKQAELNYLQANRAGYAVNKNAPVSRTQEARVADQNPRVPELSKETPAVVPSASRVKSQPEPPTSWKLIALVLFIAIAGAVIYFAATGSKTTPTTLSTKSDEKAAETPLKAATQADTMAQRELEEAQRRETLRQEALVAAQTLSVEANDFRVGLFGGIKNVQLTLSNPSDVQFTSVTVRVTYYKDNGGLYKSENVIFRNVEPGSSPVRNAPNSDRGVSIKYRIVGYESPVLTNPDSVLSANPVAPLN